MTKVLVSYFSMHAAPCEAPDLSSSGLHVVEKRLAIDTYLDLYVAIGKRWGWDQRLAMPYEELSRHLESDGCHVFVLEPLDRARPDFGFCEFHEHAPGEVQLMNFGLRPEHLGLGLGQRFLHTAVARMWAALKPSRLWLHTDTMDHRKAKATYLAVGFQHDFDRLEALLDL